MLGNGLASSLLGVRSTIEGFSTLTVGVMMAAYYLGYLAGSRMIPDMVGAVGHIRVFAGLGSLTSLVVLVHPLWVHPVTWSLLRLVTGFSLAGLYVVAESWLNGVATNANRGNVLSLYLVMVLGGLGVGQLMLGLGSPEQHELFVLVSALISLSLIPITLAPSEAPTVGLLQKTNIAEVYRITPLAIVGGAVVGITNSVLLGIGPVYGAQLGYPVAVIGQLLAAAMAGAVLLQWPLGRLSDRVPRRRVILGVTLASVGVALAGVLLEGSTSAIVGVMFLYGGLSFPLYGLVISHMNDWIPTNKLLSAAGAAGVCGGSGSGGWSGAGRRMDVGGGPSGHVVVLGLCPRAVRPLHSLPAGRAAQHPGGLAESVRPPPARGSAMVATLTPWRRTRSRPLDSRRNPKYPLTFG